LKAPWAYRRSKSQDQVEDHLIGIYIFQEGSYLLDNININKENSLGVDVREPTTFFPHSGYFKISKGINRLLVKSAETLRAVNAN
jgi:hypothetical protein